MPQNISIEKSFIQYLFRWKNKWNAKDFNQFLIKKGKIKTFVTSDLKSQSFESLFNFK